jgi:hypothetical protein
MMISKKLKLNKKSLLATADDLINVARREDYGTAYSNFSHIAMIWSALLAKKLNQPVTAQEVSLLMIGLKSARLMNSPDHTDSWIDIAGYAGCGGEAVPVGMGMEELEGILV